jgi:hypothetical protein
VNGLIVPVGTTPTTTNGTTGPLVTATPTTTTGTSGGLINPIGTPVNP